SHWAVSSGSQSSITCERVIASPLPGSGRPAGALCHATVGIRCFPCATRRDGPVTVYSRLAVRPVRVPLAWSPGSMSRTVTRLRRVALAAVLLATPLLGPLATAPAALAQSLDDPAWPADRPFPPATDGPFGWAELSYWPYAVAPSDPQFWAPNGAPMRVLSPRSEEHTSELQSRFD